MNNGRDCAHGRQVGKCDTCDLIEAEKEIEALKAQVEQLREAVMGVRDSSCTSGFGYPDTSQLKAQRAAWQKLNESLEATPSQCLAARDAEIKAQAVEQYKKSDEFCKLQDRAYRAGRTAGHNDAHFEQLQQQAKEQK